MNLNMNGTNMKWNQYRNVKSYLGHFWMVCCGTKLTLGSLIHLLSTILYVFLVCTHKNVQLWRRKLTFLPQISYGGFTVVYMSCLSSLWSPFASIVWNKAPTSTCLTSPLRSTEERKQITSLSQRWVNDERCFCDNSLGILGITKADESGLVFWKQGPFISAGTRVR